MTQKEAVEWNDPEVYPGIRTSKVASALADCMAEAVSEYITEDDGLVPPYFLEEGMMSSLGVTSVALNKIYSSLIDIGETVSERKQKDRKLPRSYIGSMGRFLQIWTMCDEEMFVKLVTAPPNAAFESYCMDPHPAAEPFRECHASVHMSGTLQPLDQYAQLLGLNDAITESFQSPFDPDNLMVLYVNDASTRFDDMIADPGNLRRLEENTVDAVTATEVNSAVFFPSYAMMDRFIEDGVTERFRKDMYYERKGSAQTELMEEIEKFKGSENSVLFAVAGGRVSEGVDFPDRDLELAVLVGIPYPKPNAKLSALTRYCDIRYGDGWGQAVRSPTVRKMRQTIGRLIRSETDRGVAVILDKRAAAIKELNAVLSDRPSSDIKRFFAKR
jgi:DNA excision repair protein ERCC-2